MSRLGAQCFTWNIAARVRSPRKIEEAGSGMSKEEFDKIVKGVVARRKRTTFAAPIKGRDNNATADRHAEYGAARH